LAEAANFLIARLQQSIWKRVWHTRSNQVVLGWSKQLKQSFILLQSFLF